MSAVRRRRARFAVLASCAIPALFALAAAPARAEFYRCTGRDGKVRFSDNPAACPRSQRHEPSGVVQTVPSVAPRRSPAAPTPSGEDLNQRVEEDAEATWRERKLRKEAELGKIDARIDYLKPFVNHCNRGGEIYGRDGRSGLKHGVSCDRVRAEAAELATHAASLREYLARGIHEECRRAGCLPGWLR